MKNKRFIPIVIALLTLLLFCLPQHVVPQGINLVKFFNAFSKPIRSGVYNPRIYSPHIFTVNTALLGQSSIASVKAAQCNALLGRPIIAPAKERDFHPNPEVLTGGIRHMDLDMLLPFSSRPHQNIFISNSSHSSSAWPTPLLRILANSYKTNPSFPLCGEWRIIGWESNDPQLESEFIDIIHPSIHKGEYITISNNIVSYFSCGQAILSIDLQSDYINSLDNETPEITWVDENVITLNFPFGDSNEELILHRVPKEIPSHIGHTTDNSTPSHIITLPQRDVEADRQSHLSVKIDASSEDTDIELLTNKCWIDYIEQIKQRIEKMEEQLFEKGMQFDFEYEFKDGEVGFIIYTYGYKLDAA